MTNAMPKPQQIEKNYYGGTHRQIPPEETMDKISRLFPIMGITRVANVTGLDSIGIPVVMVTRPNSRSLSVSQGKGLDLISAKVSGAMESIESYHAERIHLPLKLATSEELRYTHNIVDLTALPSTKESRFSPSLQILWVEGYDIVSENSCWIPFELVHTNFSLPLPTGSGCFPTTSNGLASGNHLLEAMSHAISEVIERDSTSLWMQRDELDKDKSRVNLKSIDDDACCLILEKFDQSNISVAVWETTSDIGIASFLCTILEDSDNHYGQLYASSGMGCHPSRNIALLRALTEAAQSRLTFISGARDDMTRNEYKCSQSQEVLEKFQKEMKSPTNRNFQDCPTYEGKSFNDDIEYLLKNLNHVDINQVIVVNLTKQEFDIPVVRIIIPGLEGSDEYPGYIPGARALKAKEKLL